MRGALVRGPGRDAGPAREGSPEGLHGAAPTLLIRLEAARRAALRSDTLVRFIVPRDSVDEPLSRSLEELGRYLFHLHVRRRYPGTAERRACIDAELEAWLWVEDGSVHPASRSFWTVDCDFHTYAFEALGAVRDGVEGKGVVVFGRRHGYESLDFAARLVTADSVGNPFARDETDTGGAGSGR